MQAQPALHSYAIPSRWYITQASSRIVRGTLQRALWRGAENNFFYFSLLKAEEHSRLRITSQATPSRRPNVVHHYGGALPRIKPLKAPPTSSQCLSLPTALIDTGRKFISFLPTYLHGRDTILEKENDMYPNMCFLDTVRKCFFALFLEFVAQILICRRRTSEILALAASISIIPMLINCPKKNYEISVINWL